MSKSLGFRQIKTQAGVTYCLILDDEAVQGRVVAAHGVYEYLLCASHCF